MVGIKCKNNMTGQLVVITGGSAGLGLSLAIGYVRRDANVVILARNQAVLEQAIATLNQNRCSTTQFIQSISADCMDADVMSEALLRHGVPDILIACAGKCLPRLFIDLEAKDFARQMCENYQSAVHAVLPVFRALLHKSRTVGLRKRTRIVLVSSTAAFLGLAGYSAYAPSKAALRSLADHLRQETLLYKSLRKSLRIHCVFPSTMTSPSFLNEEQKIKPHVTKVLEGCDAGQTTDVVAHKVLRQLAREHFLISPDFQGGLVKSAMLGSSPAPWWESWKAIVGRLALSVYRPMVWDREVRRLGDAQSLRQEDSQSSTESLDKNDLIFIMHRSPWMGPTEMKDVEEQE